MILRLLSAAILLTCGIAPAAFHIPYRDADSATHDEGFQVQLLQDPWGFVPTPNDLDTHISITWDHTGLLLQAHIHDDSIIQGDYLNWVIAPAVGAKENVHRIKIDQEAGNESYTIHHHISWDNLGFTRTHGDTLAMQLEILDADADGSHSHLCWYPEMFRERNPERLHMVTLARRASPPVDAYLHATYDKQGTTRVQITALHHYSQEKAKVRFGDKRTTARMALNNGRAQTVLNLPLPEENADTIAAKLDGQALTPKTLLESDEQRARLRFDIGLGPESYIFTGSQFPDCVFTHTALAQTLLGDHQIKATFYDKDYNPVQEAAAPGRYGVVIEVTGEHGPPLTRFRTLFCAPADPTPHTVTMHGFPVEADFPQLLVPNLKTERLQAQSIRDYFSRQYTLGVDTDPDLAVLMAHLYESEDDAPPADFSTSARAQDRQWWLGMKRILYDPKHVMDVDFTCPRKRIEGPAPVLRKGSEIEAGMKPGTVRSLEGILQTWAERTDEGFTVALARNGVLFFEGAYGTREGEAMTKNTPSWIASISKLVSGSLMMMLVDQELLTLDDEVARYLPALRYIDVDRPLRIRDLYNHMNGFGLGFRYPGYYPNHWGDDFHDLDEIVAEYYPRLKVGEKLGYNGVGYALGGKVIEMITEEAYPVFAKNHLIDPLEMTGTMIDDGAARTTSTAGAMARFGQMLLNKGSYGTYRFFSEEVFEQMLPIPLKEHYDVDVDTTWGVGAVSIKRNGLSDRAFGHGAASSSTFIIDPEHDLVIVMLRDRAGENFNNYHAQFMRRLTEGLPGNATP